jgi:outer membrane protein TolC
MALKNNAQLQNAALSIDIAEQQRKEAFTKYFPSISATGVGVVFDKPQYETMVETGYPAPNDKAQVEMIKNALVGGVMAMQPVFAGGQIVNGNRLAKVGSEVSRLQRQMTENEILLTTERYFWQLVALKEKMHTIESSEVMLDRILMDVKVAVEAGLTTRNDLLRVELEQNRLAAGRLKAENGLQILKMALGQHIGIPADSFEIHPTPALPTGEGVPPLVEGVRGRLEHRPEYQLIDKSVEVARLQHRMEIGKLLPTVAIGAGYNWIKMDMNRQTEMNRNTGLALATISIPITDWWGGSHAVKRKKLEILRAENTKRETSEKLQLQMQQISNELNEAFQQTELARKSIASAEENLKISRDNYNAGITTLSDLLEAQNLVQQAQDQYTEATTGYYVKLAEYKNVMGR